LILCGILLEVFHPLDLVILPQKYRGRAQGQFRSLFWPRVTAQFELFIHLYPGLVLSIIEKKYLWLIIRLPIEILRMS